MSIDHNKMNTHLVVPVLEPMQVVAAERVIRKHAVDERELGEFINMVTPEPFRCAHCGRQFPVPSMARDHEKTHEEE